MSEHDEEALSVTELSLVVEFVKMARGLALEGLRRFDRTDPEMVGYDEELRGQVYAYGNCLAMIDVAKAVKGLIP